MNPETSQLVTAVCSVALTTIILPLLVVAFGIRDDVRWLKSKMGSSAPPDGLLGQVAAFEGRLGLLEKEQISLKAIVGDRREAR